MRKADIANEIFKQVGISKNEAADIVELVLNLLKSVLQKGESVKIAGFGNFVVRSKGSRGRNPHRRNWDYPASRCHIPPKQVFKVRQFIAIARPTSRHSMRAIWG